MTKLCSSRITVTVAWLATMFLFALPGAQAQQKVVAPVAIDADDIGGVVKSAKGPEAGVWVIAETRELPTRFIKIVVTDDQGRYVLPDLPQATYDVWVRGYGLVDSAKVKAQPGRIVNLAAKIAPSARAAAQYYPAIHWYSMVRIPDAKYFGPDNTSGMPPQVTLNDYLRQIKNAGCIGCHQLGQLSTRTIPKEFAKESSSFAQWLRRVSRARQASR